MNEENRYVRFDWAAKRMLRNKADFVVFEGLISVLLGEKITIVELLESEGNQEYEDDKFNRVDIKARNSKDEIILVEIQQTRELYYLQRVLYGVAKAITEHISRGQSYRNVKKVYSINIIYFDLGQGADYLYHGQTKLTGVHTGDNLRIGQRDKEALRMQAPEEVFPEYYIIRVNEFNKLATTPLEEWLEYLKTGHIREDTTAPGLQEARERLEYLKMDRKQRAEYDNHLDILMYQNDVLEGAKQEGLAEGRLEGLAEGRAEGREEGLAEGRVEGLAEGREKGLAEGRLNSARKMKDDGMSEELIAKYTGLSIEEIQTIDF